MRTVGNAVIVLLSVITLGLSVSFASAGKLSLSSRTFQVVWTPLTFGFEEGGNELRCTVTLTGSYHTATVSKVLNSLVGYVTDARMGHPCEGSGEAWMLNGVERPSGLATTANSLPWHIRYAGFNGTLPRIAGTRIQLVAPRFVMGIFGVLCQYSPGTAEGISNIEASGRITGVQADETVAMPKQSGGFLCPANGYFIGTSAITNGAGASITITLI